MVFRYKERLETKYIKPRKLRGNSETLVGSAWTFLEKGRDDFRDGLPPEANYNYVKKVRSAFFGNFNSVLVLWFLEFTWLRWNEKMRLWAKEQKLFVIGWFQGISIPYHRQLFGILRVRGVLWTGNPKVWEYLQLEVRRQGEGLYVEFPRFCRLNHDQFANKEHEVGTMDTRQVLINQACFCAHSWKKTDKTKIE